MVDKKFVDTLSKYENAKDGGCMHVNDTLIASDNEVCK